MKTVAKFGLPVTETKYGLMVEDGEGRKINIDNPSEWNFYGPFGGSGGRRGGERGLWVMWMGQHGPTYIAIWAESLEDALEEAGEWAHDHAPGLLLDDAYLKELYADARKDLGPDATEEEVYEQAEADLTYTESGYIGSDEWGYLWDPSQVPTDVFWTIVDIGAVKEMEESRGLEDVAGTLNSIVNSGVKGASDYVSLLVNDVVAFGDETTLAKSIHAVSWDTTHDKPFMHEFLVIEGGKFKVKKADDLFTDEQLGL